jgi:glycosyltransferase involved in cell wall biosynthesis
VVTHIPIVSVLMTAYNREKFIADAIVSVMMSTFTNFELIIVDDCSNDRTLEIAREYALNDSRIKVYVNEKNLGDYNNRNLAASYARGVYIKYLDADDLIYSYSLQSMVDAMEKFPQAALGISHCIIDDFLPYPHLFEPYFTMKSEFFGISILGSGPSAAIIRKSDFWEMGGFSGKRFLGDQELWLKIGSNRPVVKLPPALVWYRRHEDQEINKESSIIQIRIDRFSLKWCYLTSMDKLFSKADFRLAKRLLIKNYFKMVLIFLIREKKIKPAFVMLRDSPIKLSDLKLFLFQF